MPNLRRTIKPTANAALKNLVHGFALGAGSTALFAAGVVGLYLAKSAAGIDLFKGHSPLHEVFFHLLG